MTEPDRADEALRDMLDHGREAVAMYQAQGGEDCLEGRRTRLALERLLEIFGEAAANVPEHRRRDLDLPWSAIVGMRNILIHAYHRTDPALLRGVLEESLPAALTALETHLAEGSEVGDGADGKGPA